VVRFAYIIIFLKIILGVKMEEVKYIQLGLENVEAINIDIDDIKLMDIDQIYENDVIYECSSIRKIEKRKYCKYVKLIIKKNADKLYDTTWYNDLTSFQRLLEFPDIVDISYLDKDGNLLDSILVPWDYLDDEENGFQTSQIDENENLEIVINAK
jgi:hypothetical protein